MSTVVRTSDLVTGTTVQQTPINTYSPGVCNCNSCSYQTPVATCNTGDWQYSTTPCCGKVCPAQPLCSTVDPTVCPSFGGKAAYSANFSQAPNVTCTYLTSQFQTTADITNYIATFGNTPQLSNQILPLFCAGSSTTCPTTTSTSSLPGITPVSCSRMLSTGQDGQICSAWAAANPAMADQAQVTYCSTAGAIGCDCVNRANNFNYRSLAQYTESNDGCWYAPCTQPTELIPSTVVGTNCPADTCSEIEAGWTKQQNYISYSTAQGLTTCPLSQPPPANSGKTTIFLWIIVILVIVLVGLIVYYLLTHA